MAAHNTPTGQRGRTRLVATGALLIAGTVATYVVGNVADVCWSSDQNRFPRRLSNEEKIANHIKEVRERLHCNEPLSARSKSACNEYKSIELVIGSYPALEYTGPPFFERAFAGLSKWTIRRGDARSNEMSAASIDTCGRSMAFGIYRQNR